MINAHRILIGRFEGKRTLGKSSCRWEDMNVEMVFKAVGFRGVY
jgi:hypothetical protein